MASLGLRGTEGAGRALRGRPDTGEHEMSNLKTLDEHNAERRESHRAWNIASQPHANGIACPKCGRELWDTNPMVTLTSMPAQKDVHCVAAGCGYRGYRLA